MIRDPISSASPTTPSYPGYSPHSPYMRRISPPGSPAPKNAVTSTRSNSTKQRLSYVAATLLGYTIIGAFTFMALEGGFHHDTAVAASKSKPRTENNVISDLRTQTVDRLWSITENLNILYRENWTKLATEEVLEFQEALFRALKSTGSGYIENSADGTIFYHHHTHRWSFSSSFLYSLTLITTIGTFLPSNKLKVSNELNEIKEIFVKIGETVSDQDIQEWVKGENEDSTFLTEEDINEVISDTEHEDVGNQRSDEEMPSVNQQKF
ncbi:potassium channel subfamily k [Holotrichia oblita]|uniref:Potassium channel subfamily k n=1 Tax=Holotrichia oblita TaxID=644536 RepID=A0ACB9SJJ7_HOLOL|nr:potassium channel subfamily k [Holotrichia oblita]